MRDKFQCIFVDLFRTLSIIRNLLFEQSIVEPEINVSFPESFLRHWWHILNCTLEDRPRTFDISVGLLFQSTVIKPQIVVEWLFADLCLQLVSSLRQHNSFNVISCPELLLESDVLFSEILAVFLLNVF